MGGPPEEFHSHLPVSHTLHRDIQLTMRLRIGVACNRIDEVSDAQLVISIARFSARLPWPRFTGDMVELSLAWLGECSATNRRPNTSHKMSSCVSGIIPTETDAAPEVPCTPFS